MTAEQRSRMQLAGMAFIQVFFVASNTAFISQYALLGNLLTAFMISWIWTFNVKRVAFGDKADRMFYAGGAAVGSVVGTITANFLLRALA